MSPIEAMPSPDLLAEAAELWSLTDLKFVRKMENIVYSATRMGKRVYLRLTTPLRRARPELEAELHWMSHLRTLNLRIPQLIPTRDNQILVSLKDGDQRYEAALFSEITGIHPDEETRRSPAFLKELGSIIATLHNANATYQALPKKREHFLVERGMRMAKEAAATSEESELVKSYQRSIEWMEALPKDPKHYGLVHLDLGSANLFVEEGNSIGLIDFDDSCYAWYLFDLMIPIYSMLMKCEPGEANIQKWLDPLLAGYRTQRELSDEEISWIPHFLEIAWLRLYFWIEHHQQLDTFHETKVKDVEELKALAKRHLMAYR